MSENGQTWTRPVLRRYGRLDRSFRLVRESNPDGRQPQPAIGGLFYLFDPNDRLVRLPRQVVDGVIAGTADMPDYAGRRICLVTVVSWLEEDQPSIAIDLITDWWFFDDTGLLIAQRESDPLPTAPELSNEQRMRIMQAVWPTAER